MTVESGRGRILSRFVYELPYLIVKRVVKTMYIGQIIVLIRRNGQTRLHMQRLIKEIKIYEKTDIFFNNSINYFLSLNVGVILLPLAYLLNCHNKPLNKVLQFMKIIYFFTCIIACSALCLYAWKLAY